MPPQPDPPLDDRPQPGRAIRLSLFLLSAAALIFQINLTRLFSVAQFYHFAFMIVSLALLGFGASGTALALAPRIGAVSPRRSLAWLAAAAGLSSLGSFLLINWLPFDSYSIAWDPRQVLILALHYTALASPFFFSGMAIGLMLASYPHVAGQIYAVNLSGSALGCVAALAGPPALGGEGTAVMSSGLAAAAALVCEVGHDRGSATAVTRDDARESRAGRIAFWLLVSGLGLFALVDSGLRLGGLATLSALDLRLSPYKGLSYALQVPGAAVVDRRWNSFSRVDVVSSPSIRSVPGLSYRYLRPPPPQDGLLVDGDDLSPVVRPKADPGFADYLSTAIAYRLRPGAEALILEPRGGLDVWVAMTLGARRVTAVEVNPLIVEAAELVYGDPRVRVVVDSDRSYLRRSGETFDVVLLSLVGAYRPVQSGAYSLAEDYRYTVESFEDALARLGPDGLLVVVRWLQTPPSESLRAFALAVTALERGGGDPAGQLVSLRGYNTATLLVRKSPFTPQELAAVREFAADRAFDLTYAPGVRPEEVNRFNVLPEPVYYQAAIALLEARPRETFYAAYAFDVSPPTDDRPFFGHYFKWAQAGQVLASLGKTWQPFGGAGYFVILALLALALLSAAWLILLPLAAARRRPAAPAGSAGPRRPTAIILSYFALIGLAYLLVELPLVQRFILYLGHPAYALTAVLFTLLLFSGAGSQWGGRIPVRMTLPALAGLLLIVPLLLPRLFEVTLGWPMALRLGLTVVALAPVGFLMGLPFPAGIRVLLGRSQGSPEIPWAWAVNGSASVVSAVLAALLALSFGFGAVLRVGALCYAGAWIAFMVAAPRARA